MGRPPQHVDFFRVWSPEMAYVLGLWWTDGMMRVKTGNGAHEIEIASIDVDHLIEIAGIIGINYSLRRVNYKSKCHAIAFCSKEMYHDLLALGGTPRKSKTIGLPDVPQELLPHFVRGVVDGDGTLGWNGDRPIIHLYSGSTLLLNSIGPAIETATGVPAPNLIANRSLWYLKWSTIRAKCLVSWMYIDHPGLNLARKKNIADAVMQWQSKKRPHKGTITEKMREVFPAYLPA